MDQAKVEVLNVKPDIYITKVVAATEYVKHYIFIRSLIIVALVFLGLTVLFRSVFMAQAVILLVATASGTFYIKKYNEEVQRLKHQYKLK
jgi:hypothetical protein